MNFEKLYFVKIMPQINLLSLFKFFHFVFTDVCGVSNEHCKHTHSLVTCSLQPTLKSGTEPLELDCFIRMSSL